MTQVSKRILARQMEEKVYATFWETIAKLSKIEDADLFFTDLFTVTERVNFIKRLAIAVLLYRGYDWRDIEDLLKVSPTTVGRVSLKMNGQGFKLFFAKIEREAGWREFWKDLAKVYLTVAHPEKVARLGYEGIDRVYFKSKKKSLL